DALALAIRLGMLDRVVRFEELAGERVLLESMDASSARVCFMHQVLGPVFAYDTGRHRKVVSTLHTYISSANRPRVAAQPLFMHVNALHCRLRRIAELLGSNWPRGQQRFRVELALRVTDLLDIRARQLAREHHAQ